MSWERHNRIVCRSLAQGPPVIVLPAGRKRIEDLVEDYLAAVRSRQPEITIGKELFSVLLQPAVIGQESKTRLIIVSDGKLHLLPFDGLRDEQGTYVLESHVVTYAPSASVLNLLRSSRSSDQAAMNFLGAGRRCLFRTGCHSRHGQWQDGVERECRR